MAKKLRYTPGPPPLKVLAKYPNWRNALDEEGEDGQDESTIRPDDVSDHIGPETEFTAADITLVSGKRLPALLFGATDLWNGNAESIAVYEGSQIWHLEFSDRAWWASKYPEGNESLVDQSKFPATVVSRLPGVPNGSSLKFELLAKGKLLRDKAAPQTGAGSSLNLPFPPKDISSGHTPETEPPNHETSNDKPSAEWIAQMKREIAARGYFGVDLWSKYNWKKQQYDPNYNAALRGEPHAEVDSALNHVLLPVLARAEFCRVFKLDTDTPAELEHVAIEERRRWIRELTHSKARATFIDLAAAPPLKEKQFWWWLIRRGRGLVAGIPVNLLEIDELFRQSTSPNILTNLGVVIDPIAIEFAKDKTRGGQFVCLCPDKHSGIQLHIFAGQDLVLDLFDRAVNAPRPPGITTRMDSRYWVLTFEQEKALHFLFEAEEKKSTEFLSAALKAAIANLNHPATVLRALAAGEILAAAHGKPAALYNGSHNARDINRSVLRLAKKLPAPVPEILKLARDVIAIIAGHSSSPKEIWLSQEARDLWRERQVDLHSRLK
jgi:hypothetical protein